MQDEVLAGPRITTVADLGNGKCVQRAAALVALGPLDT